MNPEIPPKCGLCGPLWSGNPIAVYALGLCPALAATDRLAPALVMGLTLTGVCLVTSLIFSLLKPVMPRPGRMLIELMLVAAVVTVFDLAVKAYFPQASPPPPYIALIVTNCILLYRIEAMAMSSGLWRSALGGLTNGLGFAGVLALLGSFRELAGTGAVLGYPVLPPGSYGPNRLVAQAGGAFLGLGLLVAALNAVAGRRPAEGEE